MSDQPRFKIWFERAIPSVRDVEVVSSEAFARWHVARSFRAMGAAETNVLPMREAAHAAP